MHNFFNKLDLMVVPISFLLTFVSITRSSSGICENGDASEEVAAALLISIRILRTLRALRLLRTFDQFFTTLAATFMPMKRLLAVIFLFFYFFGIVGMELFAARFVDPRPFISDANKARSDALTAASAANASEAARNASRVNFHANIMPADLAYATTRVAESSYGLNGYWPVNFDDMFHALVSLFTLLVVNNWPITMEGYESIFIDKQDYGGPMWPRAFFFAFYLTAVIVVVNVVTGFIIDVFSNAQNSLEMAKDVIDAGAAKLSAKLLKEKGGGGDDAAVGATVSATATSKRRAACCTISFGDHTGLGVWGGIVLADRRVCRCCCGAPPAVEIEVDAPIVMDESRDAYLCAKLCACAQWPIGGVHATQALPEMNPDGEEADENEVLPAWVTVWHQYRQPRVWEARILDVARDMGCLPSLSSLSPSPYSFFLLPPSPLPSLSFFLLFQRRTGCPA